MLVMSSVLTYVTKEIFHSGHNSHVESLIYEVTGIIMGQNNWKPLKLPPPLAKTCVLKSIAEKMMEINALLKDVRMMIPIIPPFYSPVWSLQKRD